jgi:dUTP pyrophosphatase
LDNNAKLPIRASGLAVGIDMIANEDIIILSGQCSPLNTGIALVAPPETYARLAPKSGLAVKHGIDIGTGVVDEDYWGEIKVILINNLTISFQVQLGESIVQWFLEKILRANGKKMKDLLEMIRGSRGFGSND